MSTAKSDALLSKKLTEHQYLENEKVSEHKCEYVKGRVYAMAADSKNHDTIATTVLRKFGNHLEDSNCRPYCPDLKIKTAADHFRSSDGMVVCDDSEDDHFTETPVVIIEVLSKSTRLIDRGAKLLEYINVPSSQEYVMIEQDFVSIDVLRHSEGWILHNYTLGDEAHFQSIDLI